MSVLACAPNAALMPATQTKNMKLWGELGTVKALPPPFQPHTLHAAPQPPNYIRWGFGNPYVQNP